jgi:4-hydroxymandelate oxidase
MKIIIEGILAHEDATLCVQNDADGLIVSNHGGRGEDSGRLDGMQQAPVESRSPVHP